MSYILEVASRVLSDATARTETAAQNLTNIATRGYKRKLSFAEMVTAGDGLAKPLATATDFSAGKPVKTGNPYDLSIDAGGFFAVRQGDRILYTRSGQFRRDDAGRLVLGADMVLQAQGGGDLTLQRPGLELAADGTVIEDASALARVAVVTFGDMSALVPVEGGAFAAPDDAATPVEMPRITQGSLEAANVSAGEEMVAMMAAVRHAESGQRIVQVYDELMGRAISTFGEAGK